MDLGLLLPVVVVFFTLAIKVREYERLVVFRLRLIGEKAPGLVFIIPFIDRFIRVSCDITRCADTGGNNQDNVTTSVNAAVYRRWSQPGCCKRG